MCIYTTTRLSFVQRNSSSTTRASLCFVGTVPSYYERGDLPVQVFHDGRGKIQWKVEIDKARDLALIFLIVRLEHHHYCFAAGLPPLFADLLQWTTRNGASVQYAC